MDIRHKTDAKARRSLRTIAFLALGLAAAAGCSSTRIFSEWSDPSMKPVAFHRVLVVSPSSDESFRRVAEDTLVKELMPHTRGVPSYQFLTHDQLQNKDQIRAVVRNNGLDGVVVFRVTSVNQQVSWVPGMYSGGFYAYGGWPFYDPGYMQVDTVARVETNVYGADDERLIWSSASNTFNPKNAQQLVRSVAKQTAKAMRKEGVILD